MKSYAVYAVFVVGLTMLSVALVAQTPPVTGDRSSPLRPLTGAGNVGVSNAVLRDQPEIRALRVVVEPGGTRPIHAHSGVEFHLFVPISGPMELNLDGGRSVQVRPWHPYFLPENTQHGFHNSGSTAVEIMEIFIR
jgi:quercetin dioxygenase-like cupin family protein